MYLTYLRRELGGRKKQSIIVAAGLALAIALVIIVSAVSAGVKNAQAATLASVYGVGTDLTITQAQTPGSGGGQQFQFGSGSGSGSSTSDGSGQQQLSQSQLRTTRGTTAYADTALATVTTTSGVSAATGTLALESTSFSGSIPSQGTQQAPSAGSGSGTGSGSGGGPSSFSVDSFTVTGVDPAATTVGPLTSTKLSSGRLLTAADAGKDDVVVDSTYATSNSLEVGSTLSIGGTDFTVVGIVTSTTSDSATASDTYIPLDVAQTLSDNAGKITTIYVAAASASDVTAVQTALEKELTSTYTVSSQADLASSVSGSLATASSLISGLGTWLSIIVLLAAFGIAILFTISGVGRRVREFGTLKAIGWRNGRIVRQVAGESLAQGLLGGVIGVAVGLVGILVIDLVAPTLSTASAAGGMGGTGGQGGPGGGMGGALTQAATDVALQAPVTVGIILLAVGLSIAGGLLAGAFGGWRASRLRPAEALRSVA
jgi:putative ABC transport system permease protein